MVHVWSLQPWWAVTMQWLPTCSWHVYDLAIKSWTQSADWASAVMGMALHNKSGSDFYHIIINMRIILSKYGTSIVINPEISACGFPISFPIHVLLLIIPIQLIFNMIMMINSVTNPNFCVYTMINT